MEITILGCGPSYGIPTARFGFGDCNPNNPKNIRSRTGLLISENGTDILIDTPPELRQQLYSSNIQKVDAVIWTHMHSDHLMGIDDVRIYTRNTIGVKEEVIPLPVYIHEKDWAEFQQRFPFYLKPFAYLNQPVAPFTPHLINAGQFFSVNGVEFLPILQNHGNCESLGFQLKNFAYNTDLTDFVDFDIENLKGIDLWILDCVTTRFNNKHIYLEKALQWFDIVKPKKMVLTHLGAKMDYDTISAQLPKGVELAYDGMKLKI